MNSFKRVTGVVGLAVLPMCLGGGNSYEAIAALFSIGGLILVLSRHRLNYVPSDLRWAALLIGWCALASFWPADWTWGESWRDSLSDSRQAYLPPTLSPQPWVSLESLLLLSLGALWFMALRGSRMKSGLRYGIVSGIILSLVVIGIFSWLEFGGVLDIPIWNPGQGMGPFVNRNQFGYALSVGVTLACGMLLQDRARHRFRAAGWAVAAVFFFILIVINGSRGGLLLALGGMLLVGAGEFVLHPKIDRLGRNVSVILLAGAVLLFWGGTSVDRLVETFGSQEAITGGVRSTIHREAWEIVKCHPVLGTGAGQFKSIFPLYQDQYTAHKRIVHPESDWLWLAVESGLTAWLIMAGWICLVARDIHPVRAGRGRRLRWVGGVCGLLLFLHGWVEVSGHRPGTAFLGLLLLAMSSARSRVVCSRPRPALPLVAGVLFLGFGMGMGLTRFSLISLPGTYTNERAQEQAIEQYREGTLDSTTLDQWLRQAPLSPILHYYDGLLHHQDRGSADRTADAFEASATLDPYNRFLHIEIARLRAQDDLPAAVALWERLLRLEGDDASRFATEIVRSMPSGSGRDALWMLSLRYPLLLFPLVSSADADELARWSVLVFQGPPPEGENNIEALLLHWSQISGIELLYDALRSSPAWLERAWLVEALWLRDQRKHEEAAKILRQHLEWNIGDVPQVSLESMEKLQKRLLRNGNDPMARIQLATYYYLEKRYREAITHGEAIISSMEKPPLYLYGMIGDAACEQGDWQKAFDYFYRYYRLQKNQTGSK